MGEYSIYALIIAIFGVIITVYLLFFYKTEKLFHFKKEMKAERIIKKIKNRGFRPATDRELLSFIKKTKLKKGQIIVALGSSYHNREDYAPIVIFRDGEKYWSATSVKDSIKKDYFFLGVRENILTRS